MADTTTTDKVTPAPWLIDGEQPWQIGSSEEPEPAAIATVWSTEEDARLIAAAPEMAEMLRELYDHLVANAAGEYLDISDHYIRIGDLLAKAGVKLS